MTAYTGETLAGIREERAIFTSGQAVDFATYERTSLRKQSVGFPPALALAYTAGWSEERRRAMQRALASIWLALQMPDDVFARSFGTEWFIEKGAPVGAGPRPGWLVEQ